MPLLTTEGAYEMRYQSYVHLDHYFEIEAKHLTPVEGKHRRPIRIDGHSRRVLMYKFRTFLTDTINRNRTCNFPSPMDVHRNTIPRIENFPYLRQLADEGQRMEYARLWQYGGEYTVYEKWPLKPLRPLPPPPALMPPPPAPMPPPPAPLPPPSFSARHGSRDSGYGSNATSPVLGSVLPPPAPQAGPSRRRAPQRRNHNAR